MKKIITTCAMGALFASSLSADFIRVEAGAGAWQQTPSGYAERTDGDGVLSLNGRYDSDEKEATQAYAWILFKHPVPLIPNLRLEYVSISDDGVTSGTSVGGIPLPVNVEVPTSIDMTQYDIIPYYNLLDNTFWITLDLGIDLKVIQSDVELASTTGFSGYSSTDTVAIPFVYARTRVEIPVTNIGLEADIKYISYGSDTMYEARAKVDYTFDFVPVVQPALEVGYRIQKMRIDDGSSAQVDIDYSGVYAGVMVRF